MRLPVFDSFEQRADPGTVRRLAVSTMAALAVYACIAAVLSVLAVRAANAPEKEKTVDVSFRPPPPPPPAPPPKIEAAPKPKLKPVATPKPVIAEPVVAAPAPAPAPAPILAPKEVPTAKAPESQTEVKPAIISAVGGTGTGAGAGDGDADEGSGSSSGTAHAVAGGPINLPEDADPPEEEDGNVRPDFPEEARASGKEGLVVLKIVVNVDGSVGGVKVMKGEEPFVAAAVAAVKTWRYTPAMVDGQPTAVFRIVKMPFRLKS